MNRATVVAALLAPILLAGCGAPSSGDVVEKKHEPGRHYESMEQVQNGTTCRYDPALKTTRCEPVYVWQNVPRYDDEDWKLLLRSGDNEGWREVSRSDYKAADVGSYYEAK